MFKKRSVKKRSFLSDSFAEAEEEGVEQRPEGVASTGNGSSSINNNKSGMNMDSGTRSSRLSFAEEQQDEEEAAMSGDIGFRKQKKSKRDASSKLKKIRPQVPLRPSSSMMDLIMSGREGDVASSAGFASSSGMYSQEEIERMKRENESALIRGRRKHREHSVIDEEDDEMDDEPIELKLSDAHDASSSLDADHENIMIPDEHLILAAKKKREEARRLSRMQGNRPSSSNSNKKDFLSLRSAREDVTFSSDHGAFIREDDDDDNEDVYGDREHGPVSMSVELSPSRRFRDAERVEVVDSSEFSRFGGSEDISAVDSLSYESSFPGSSKSVSSFKDVEQEIEQSILRLQLDVDVYQTRLKSIDDRLSLLTSDSSSSHRSEIASDFAWFQEMDVFLEELADCLGEKVPRLEEIADEVVSAFSFSRSSHVRFVTDIAQSELATDYFPSFFERKFAPKIEAELREKLDSLTREVNALFDDVEEEFLSPHAVASKFERWKFYHYKSYVQAYIGASLPMVFSPLVRLDFVRHASDLVSPGGSLLFFENSSWFSALFSFAENPPLGSAMSSLQDSIPDSSNDSELIPTLIDGVLMPIFEQILPSSLNLLCESTTSTLARDLEGLAEFVDPQGQHFIEALGRFIDAAETQVEKLAIVCRNRISRSDRIRDLSEEIVLPCFRSLCSMIPVLSHHVVIELFRLFTEEICVSSVRLLSFGVAQISFVSDIVHAFQEKSPISPSSTNNDGIRVWKTNGYRELLDYAQSTYLQAMNVLQTGLSHPLFPRIVELSSVVESLSSDISSLNALT